MIGHQAVGVNGAAEARRKSGQVIQIGNVVAFFEEAVRAIMPALYDVQAEFWNLDARPPRHKTENGAALARLTAK